MLSPFAVGQSDRVFPTILPTAIWCFLIGCLATPAWAQTSPPVIANGGILNAADYGAAIAPGTMVSIFGTNLAPRTATASSIPLPTTLEGVTVEAVSGTSVSPLPLYFVSVGQINAQLPYSVAGNTLDVRVRTAAGTSASQRVTLALRAPRLFTRTMDGKGEAILLHAASYRLVTEAEPARAGEYLILYLTGLGEVSPSVQPGRPGGDGGGLGPLNQVTTPVTATIGGQIATVAFAGLAPGFVGVYQLNLQAPAGLTLGKPTVVITAAAATSQGSVWISAGAPAAVSPEKVLETALSAQARGDVSAMMADMTTFDGSAATLAAARKAFDVVQRTAQFSNFQFTHLATSLGDQGSMALVRAKVAYTATVRGQSQPLSYGLMAVLTKVSNAWKVAAIVPDELLNLEDAAGIAPQLVNGRSATTADLKQINQWINEAMKGSYVNQDKLGLAITYGIVGKFGPIGDGAANGYQVYETLNSLKDSISDIWNNGLSPIGVLKLEQVGAGIMQIVTEPIPGVDSVADGIQAGLEQVVFNLEIERALRQFKLQLFNTPVGGASLSPQLALLEPFKFNYPAGMETSGDPNFVHAAGQPLRSVIFKAATSVGHRMPFRVLGEIAVEQGAPLKALMEKMGGTLRGSTYYVPVDVTHLVSGEVVSGDVLLDNYGRYRGEKSGMRFVLWDANCRRGRELLRVKLRSGETTPVVNVSNWFMNVVSSFSVPEVDAGNQFKMTVGAQRTFTVTGTSGLLEQRFWPALIPWPACFDMQVLDSSVATMQRGTSSARVTAVKKGNTELVLLLPGSAGDDSVKELRQSIPISIDGTSLMDWLQLTRGFFMTARISWCYQDTTSVERCSGGDFTIATERSNGSWAGTPALAWTQTHFAAKGRTTQMHNYGGNYDVDLSGDVDAAGTTLKHARLLVKNYNPSGDLSEDWDVELFDYPLSLGSESALAMCTNCAVSYEPYKPPDWSQKIKINKMSTYSTLNGQTREVRKFTRIQSVSSSWVFLGRP